MAENSGPRAVDSAQTAVGGGQKVGAKLERSVNPAPWAGCRSAQSAGHTADGGRWTAALWMQSHALELGLSVVFLAVALAARLPNLLMLPRYTDEGVEVLWALDIARGVHFPLTAVDSYYGPFFPYLIAVLFRVFGVSIVLPRLTAAIFGALTVVATYWLGRVMWNSRAGLVAAALALTNPALVISSHNGWSNALVPFFFTTTAACIYAGVARQNQKLLALSGLLAALTLQTHPLAGTALAGMLVWFLWRRDIGTWLRRRATWLAAALFLFGYSPIIVANLGFGGSALQDASNRQYAFAPTVSPGEYATRLAGLARHIYSIVGDAPIDTLFSYGLISIAIACLSLAGIMLAWRRGNGLLAAILILSFVLLSVLVKVFTGLTGDRYITFLIPIADVAVGGAIIEVGRWMLSGTLQRAPLSGALRRALPTVIGVFVLVLVGFPVTVVVGQYNRAFASGQTNESLFRLMDTLKTQGACGPSLFLQENVNEFAKNPVEATYTVQTMHYLLTLDGCQHVMSRAPKIINRLGRQSGQTGWIIIPERSLNDYAPQLQLEPLVKVAPYPNALPGPFVLYRATVARAAQSILYAGKARAE